MAQDTKDNQEQETPTVAPVPFSPNTPGPPIKMIAIVAGAVLVMGALALGVYFYFSNPSRPLNDVTVPDKETAEEPPAENNDGAEEGGEMEKEEENGGDYESILERVAFNVLEAESLSYTYSYNSTNDFALGISTGDPGGRSNGRVAISAEYRFQAVGLDDPDNAIIRQSISITYDTQDVAGSTAVDFNVIRHRNDFYFQLLSREAGQFLPLVDQSAVDSTLLDKWLKFTLEDGRFLELENGDLSHLEGTLTGLLLETILQEMITVNDDNRGGFFIPLDFFAGASYLDSPFVFGVADNRGDRRSIFRTMVGFGEGGPADKPETIFAIGDCEADVGETLTCQSKSQLGAFKAEDIFEIYGDLLDKANLAGILPPLAEEDFDQLLLDPEDITARQGEITVNLNSELPLLATSTTTFSAEREGEQTGSRDRISGQTYAELSYEGFNEDIDLSLPTDLTPLSELR
ncbi:hypothetical protein F4X86_03660 [Candidatus Saccharibacteria bacterium]|nr:hypothetical protein [Candidatus Saccharibacteria bacterium]